MTNETTCLNCGESYVGQFCPHCGQRADTRRFSTRKLLQTIFVALFGGDSIFLRTCFKLLTKPGAMIREFLSGKRVYYLKPIRLLLYLIAIYAIVSLIGDGSYTPFDNNLEGSIKDNIHSPSLMRFFGLINWMLANTEAYVLFSVFMSVIPFWWIFKRQQFHNTDGSTYALNLAEHFYTLVYVYCQYILFTFIMMLFSGIEAVSSVMESISALASLFFLVWTYHGLYQINWFKSLFLCIVAQTITLLVTAILTILIFGIFYGIDAVAS